MKDSLPSIAIVGGGIAGLTTAIALQKQGFRPIVFEAAPEIKALGAGLLLAANAMRSLERIGIAEKITPVGQQLDTFSILDQHGRPITVANAQAVSARFGLHNFAIHRADLHRVLLQELGNAELMTGKKAMKVAQNEARVTLHFQDGSHHETDYAIVCDGVHSAIRQQLIPDSRPRYAGYTCWRAVVPNTGFGAHAASETWGAAGRMGIVPLVNNLVYWFLCVNAPQNDPEMRGLTVYDLANRFSHYHEPIPQLLQATRNDQLIHNDIIDIAPIKKYAHDRVLLLGDAAHATTPNLGQGACQAIEDVAVLLDLWENKQDVSLQAVFQAFEKRRLSRTHAIVNRSWSLGKLAQLTNPAAILLRNGLLRMVPPSLNEQQMAELYRVDF